MNKEEAGAGANPKRSREEQAGAGLKPKRNRKVKAPKPSTAGSVLDMAGDVVAVGKTTEAGARTMAQRERIAELESDNERLRKENDRLRKENVDLRARGAEPESEDSDTGSSASFFCDHTADNSSVWTQRVEPTYLYGCRIPGDAF